MPPWINVPLSLTGRRFERLRIESILPALFFKFSTCFGDLASFVKIVKCFQFHRYFAPFVGDVEITVSLRCFWVSRYTTIYEVNVLYVAKMSSKEFTKINANSPKIFHICVIRKQQNPKPRDIDQKLFLAPNGGLRLLEQRVDNQSNSAVHSNAFLHRHHCD